MQQGEAFAAANNYKEEMEKALGLAKQRQEEAREAREHEKLAHTQVRHQPAGQLLCLG